MPLYTVSVLGRRIRKLALIQFPRKTGADDHSILKCIQCTARDREKGGTDCPKVPPPPFILPACVNEAWHGRWSHPVFKRIMTRRRQRRWDGCERSLCVTGWRMAWQRPVTPHEIRWVDSAITWQGEEIDITGRKTLYLTLVRILSDDMEF